MPESKAKLPLFFLNVSAFFLFLILILILIQFPGACLARHQYHDRCGSVFCGNLNISYPFRLKTQPPNCGYHQLELECDEDNNRAILTRKTGKFSVKEINYENQTLRVVDASLEKNDCSSLPPSSFQMEHGCEGGTDWDIDLRIDSYAYPFTFVYLMNCTRAMKSSLRNYVDASRCANSSSRPSSYFYFSDLSIAPSDMIESCRVELENVVPFGINDYSIAGLSTVDIYNNLSLGFHLSWNMDLFCDLGNALHRNEDECKSASCGNLEISYPFRLKTQPSNCGYRTLELECDNNNRTTLAFENKKFYVKEIGYDWSIRVVDASVLENGDRSSGLPQSFQYVSILDYNCENVSYPFLTYASNQRFMYLLNCTKAMKSPLYVDASFRANSSSPRSSYLYFLDGDIPPSDMNESCTVLATYIPITINNKTITGMSTEDIYNNLSMGFELLRGWGYDYCGNSESFFDSIFTVLRDAFLSFVNAFVYYIFRRRPITFGYADYLNDRHLNVMCLSIIGARMLLGISILIALVINKLRRRHLSADDTIEEFLQSQNNLMPISYSYYEIKRITRGFKDKLGAGGYGSVFKGKLRSGHLVAVKLLDSTKANGQDFIAEVATIGRIHHVNVAKLIGFCVEGSKQALVYDFMPNGSLERILFAKENKINLSWQKMFDIAVGVARGIEYLHQGCDMQILHFDIKPHNILLDEKFIPKVSDFGLAKLYSADQSIVSLTTARGTIGYIAPELVYKNLGGISYKADVYSFGMLLMEIVGKRKNLNAFAEHSSQIYFPSWIYDRVQKGEDIELEEITDGEKIIMRKMIIVAFWCVQLKPNNRPSMGKVLEMLESDVELLEMPPEPFQLPVQVPTENNATLDNANIENPATSLPSTNEISSEVV